MTTEAEDIDRDLAQFEARNSRQGLMLRYARARVSSLVGRLGQTMLGVIALLILVPGDIALLAGGLVLLAEAVDCVFLSMLPRLLGRGWPARGVQATSVLTAALHGAAIAFGVVIAWLGAPDYPAASLSLALLMGAAINAAFVLPLNPNATIARLAVYLATVPVLFAGSHFGLPGSHETAPADLLAALMLGYMSLIFARDTLRNRANQLERGRQMLLQGRQLARVNQDLERKQKDLRYLALVARHANDSVIMSGPDGRIQWVNDAFTRITGYSMDEALGKRPADLLDAPETSKSTSDAIARALAQGRPYRAQILNRTRDGRRIWVGTNLVPVLDADGKVELSIAIERDITDIKAREAELAAAKDRAEAGEAAKSQFLAAMSHEIRTPMNGILGMADLLSEAELDRESRQCVDTIRRSGEALLTIINDILDFSKLSAGKLATHAIDFPLREPIDGAIQLLGPQARAKGLYLDVVAETALPARVLGDDGRLRQILLNILGNAIKFTPRGGVTVTLACHPEGDGHRLSIAVRDTGIGIAPDRIEHVFEEFAQADAATTRQFGGTGLGLSISRLLAREMGGDVTVTSVPGQGSCFTISLHFGAVADDRPAPARPPEVAPAALTGKTVLVAEDNKTNQLLLRKYLKGHDLTLHFADNGQQAVDMVAAHDPDIVLMDMAMPVMDGLAATREIRKTRADRPQIIALTANAFASDKATCLGAGMNGFLTKPLRRDDLLRVLSQSLGTAPDNGQAPRPA